MAELRQLARTLFEQAIADCSIERSFERLLQTRVDRGSTHLWVGGEAVISLDSLKQLRVVAAGKAAPAMLHAFLTRLPHALSYEVRAVLIAPQPPADLPAAIQFFPGGHPLPNPASLAAADAALSMLRAVRDYSPEEALCVFLLSGGASAMMELPLDPSISLDDTVAFHRTLVHSGAAIVEMNCVRKHFSAVKGGRLALAAGSATKLSLLVSDVPPAHLDALASGPTMPDPTTVADCREILARYSLLQHFPVSVRNFFQSDKLSETPKLSRRMGRAWKLLDSDDLAEAARRIALGLGFHTVVDNTCDDWTFAAAADYLLERLRQLRREHSRVCLISTGEVTVKVPASPAQTFDPAPAIPGVGGRNQHFALYLATQLKPSDDPVAVLSAGSDGIDGNSMAAGAVIDQHTLDGEAPRGKPSPSQSTPIGRRASALQALENFNSSRWLETVGATVITGPTGHNLRDLRILLADRLH